MPRKGRLGRPSSPAAAAGASDHGDLTGLADNDHPQYETSAEAATKVSDHAAAADPHGDRAVATSALGTHESDTTSIHGITNTASLETTSGAQAKVDTHVNDTSAAHAASAIAFTPAGTIAATDVQAAIAEMLSEGITQLFQVPFAKQSTIATTTDSTALRWYNRSGRTLTFTMVELAIVTAPTGAAVLVDVNVDGTTIFSTQGNRPTIAISGNEGNTTTFNTTTVADGHYITVNIDQIGSTVAGADLTATVWLKG